jgi:hypothetical protein
MVNYIDERFERPATYGEAIRVGRETGSLGNTGHARKCLEVAGARYLLLMVTDPHGSEFIKVRNETANLWSEIQRTEGGLLQ